METPTGRIVGGKEAAPGQWPSLALLYNKKQNNYCTATLVTPLWAIASYACVVANNKESDKANWTLYAGSTNKADNSSRQVRKVEEIVQHPQVRKCLSVNQYVRYAKLRYFERSK